VSSTRLGGIPTGRFWAKGFKKGDYPFKKETKGIFCLFPSTWSAGRKQRNKVNLEELKTQTVQESREKTQDAGGRERPKPRTQLE